MMQTSLEAIANKAKKEKTHRFQDLYRMLNEELLRESWGQLNKKAATGVDGRSYRQYGENLEENIRNVVEKLKRKRYRAKLVRRQYLRKDDGGKRPLGIPAIEDKLLQHAVKRILQAIYEQDFLASSHGYRPGRGAQETTDELAKVLTFGRYSYVVEADIKGYFDSIDHEWMIEMLKQRIDDKAFTRLIKKWLKAGVLETDGKVIHPHTGSPQGGVVSPILSVIYMHYVLNLWFEKKVKPRCRGDAYLCVYADDFVTAFEYKEDAERFYDVLGKRLEKFGLQISVEKTRILKFGKRWQEESEAFEFLGFEFRWSKSRTGKDWVKRTTAKKNLRRSTRNLKKWCKKQRHERIDVLFKKLNAKLRGHYNYFGVIGNSEGLQRFYARVVPLLYKWLNRRSQCRSYTWEGYHSMLHQFRLARPRITQRKQRQRYLFRLG